MGRHDSPAEVRSANLRALQRATAVRVCVRLLAALAAALLPACATVGYLTQAAHGQWQVLHARRPIERVIADPATRPELKARLSVVEDARAFAVSDLGLPDNRSYHSYSDLKRPYVVWNVVAAPRFSVHPRRWCFPIAGCIDYRGYFHERQSRRFAATLAARGDDVLVEGVTAYSTLGHFADPVLNTMLRYDDMELVSTIFHELAHQLIYVRGDSEFNESFAMTVQTEGLARWLRARGRSADMQLYSEQRRVDQAINEAFTAGRSQLNALYTAHVPAPQMRERKREILDHTGQQVLAIEHQAGMHSEYDTWIGAGLNNAELAAVGTYFDCVPGFQRLLQQKQDDLQQFYSAVRALAADPVGRRALCSVDRVSTPGAASASEARATALRAR